MNPHFDEILLTGREVETTYIQLVKYERIAPVHTKN